MGWSAINIGEVATAAAAYSNLFTKHGSMV
jgi:hypothetical protein